VVADLIQLGCVLVYTEYLYYEVIRKQDAVLKADAAHKTTFFAELQESYHAAFWLSVGSWTLNLVPTIDGFLRLVTKGFAATFKGNTGDLIKFISVFVIFMTTTISISFNYDWLDPLTFLPMSNLNKLYQVFVCVKLVGLLLTVGRRIEIVNMLLTVLVKAASLCSALFQMLFIVMLVFSSVGMALFGGNVTSLTPAAYKKITGGDWDSNSNY
jgi:hypothetical protein